MLKQKIIINFQLHKQFFEDAKDIGEVKFGPFSSEDVFRKELKEAKALIVAFVEVNEDLLRSAPNLKIVARFGVGYDSVDVDACTKKGIYVTHTPGILSDAVAELTIGLMLSLSRNICIADKYVREDWLRSNGHFPMCGDLKGKKLGIIGLGSIGCALASKIKNFGMRLVYNDVKRNLDAENSLGIDYVKLDDLLKTSDFVSVHVPLKKSTTGLIGEKEFRLMKNTSCFINTSRGQVVDESALCRALGEKWIAGAALDVFEIEPLPSNNTLIDMKNVILTPHIGTATLETRRAMALKVIDNVKAVLDGRRPSNAVPEQSGMTF